MKASRGNILFLILLAVVLFAALAYAVTQSMRGGGNDVSKENNTALTALLLNYATQMEQTVLRMTLTGNVKPEQLDFSSSGNLISNSGNNSCTTNACKVFHVDGGGMTPMATPARARGAGVTQNLVNGDVQSAIYLTSVKDIGTSLPEIILLIRGVNDAICNEVNTKFGVFADTSSTITDNMGVGNTSGGASDYVLITGSMNPFPVTTADVLGDADARLAGKTTFCFRRSPLAGNYIVHVLYAR